MESIEIIGKITNIEIIAKGTSIHDIKRLRKQRGKGRWRKLKGIATVKFPDDEIELCEVHWYEVHGIGKKDMKVKYYLE